MSKPAPGTIAAGLAAESSLPVSQSAALAAIYMLGCITFFLLIRYSKSLEHDGTLVYDSASAVFFTELFKCLFSIAAMYYRTGKFLPVSVFRDGTWKTGIYFAFPSAVYAVYNNFTYFNLGAFDPGTYQVFMQTRVLFTGVLYSWVLSKTLTNRKWLALVLLTFGVAAKYLSFDLQVDYRVVFMLLQASLSAVAGVYNEFLLKRDITMDVNEQNFFMYTFALIFNLGWSLAINPSYYTTGKAFQNLNGVVLLIVVNGAVIGIVTSLILKYINVIVKAFASACEVLLTAVLAALFLGESLTSKDVVASCVVMGAIYVYYTGPPAPASNKEDSKA
jgi:UDP-sugar transporter A1/2/3